MGATARFLGCGRADGAAVHLDVVGLCGFGMAMNFLSSLVGRATSTVPYAIDAQQRADWGGLTMADAQPRDGSEPATAFRKRGNAEEIRAARNGAKRLRTVRHPNVLRLIDSYDLENGDDGQGPVVYVVTERVKTLREVLHTMKDFTAKQRNEYLAWGLKQITAAVSFLNNDCNLVHGNVCMDAVVVTEKLEWKLHGFDLLSDAKGSNLPEWPLQDFAWMVQKQYKPAEFAKGDWETIHSSPPWAIDAWGLGCLIQEVFAQNQLNRTEDLRRTQHIPQALLPDYQRLLASTPSKRMNPSRLTNSAFFNNSLVDIMVFLENFALRDDFEKDTFFKKLPAQMESIPPPVLKNTLLPLVINALEYNNAPASALNLLLKLGQDVDEQTYAAKISPCIVKLSGSPERSIRITILLHMDKIAPHMDAKVVDGELYPKISTGFLDQSGYIRELTLKSIASLAPKMKEKTLTGSLLKHLAKLQVDSEPSIRANTTILLSNIAQYLGKSTCERVLLNAFCRALKDNFPPSRSAGLLSMGSTAKYYTADEIAQRALPAVSPMMVDRVQEVRREAFKVTKVFFGILQENAKKLDEADAASSIEKKASETSSFVPNGEAQGSASSLLGWAVSSFSNLKTSKANDVSSLEKISSVKLQDPAPPEQKEAPRPHSTASAPLNLHTSTSTAPSGTPPSLMDEDIGMDHEGDDAGWDDIDIPILEPPPSRPIKPIAPPPGPARKTPSNSGSMSKVGTARNPPGGMKSEEDKLWDQLGMSAPAPTINRGGTSGPQGMRRPARPGSMGAMKKAEPPKKLGATKKTTPGVPIDPEGENGH